MRKLLILMIIMIICGGCSNETVKISVSPISTSEVFEMIDDDSIYIIDVREEAEYVSGHLKNAINIPVSVISNDLVKQIPLESKIIVYCMSGARSKIASEKLTSLGYQNIYDMGGISNWEYDVVTD